eukprot:m.76593 g.76593  ORF g.76593 m.76593 type:complete len:711 (+) comp10542_c0_seq1:64-2196(+)
MASADECGTFKSRLARFENMSSKSGDRHGASLSSGRKGPSVAQRYTAALAQSQPAEIKLQRPRQPPAVIARNKAPKFPQNEGGAPQQRVHPMITRLGKTPPPVAPRTGHTGQKVKPEASEATSSIRKMWMDLEKGENTEPPKSTKEVQNQTAEARADTPVQATAKVAPAEENQTEPLTTMREGRTDSISSSQSDVEVNEVEIEDSNSTLTHQSNEITIEAGKMVEEPATVIQPETNPSVHPEKADVNSCSASEKTGNTTSQTSDDSDATEIDGQPLDALTTVSEVSIESPEIDDLEGIQFIPDELLLKVFKYVDSETLLTVVPKVCRSWRAVVTDVPIDLNLSFLSRTAALRRDAGTPNGHRLLCNLIDRFRKVVAVNLDGHWGLGNGTLAAIAERCPHLVTSAFHNCEGLVDGAVATLSRSCPQLVSVDFSFCAMLTDQAVLELSAHCPKLKSATFAICPQLSDVGLSGLAAQCADLEILNCSYCTLLTDSTLVALSTTCRRLKRVKFDKCNLITDDGVVALALRCPGLVDVNFANCRELTDVSLSTLAVSCPQLERVSFFSTFCLTDTSVCLLAASCPRLELVDVAGSNNVTDEAVLALAKHCPGLRSVNLNCCTQISDASIVPLAESCPDLQIICLHNCAQVTDVSVLNLVQHPKSFVDFNGCTLTATSGQAVAEHCPNLKNLLYLRGWAFRRSFIRRLQTGKWFDV